MAALNSRNQRNQPKLLGPDDRVSNTSAGAEQVPGGDSPFQPGDDDWLRRSRDSYQSSENYFDASIRRRMEDNLRAFNSQHPNGSKYYTNQFQKRSKFFRPKTRTAIRKGEAATAIAFFSTSDVVDCEPVDVNNPQQTKAASIHKSLLNARLDDPKMYWFQTVVGASQDARTQGVVISKQFWRFKSKKIRLRDRFEDEAGQSLYSDTEHTIIEEDRPDCVLKPVENIRFDPAADWRDPINDSPYVIELDPMYIGDIKQKIASGEYRNLSDAMLTAALQQDWDSIRAAREGERLDKYDNATVINDYQTVWVHHNIARVDGVDYIWDTLGTEIILSDPKPLREVYAHNMRPYVLGVANIESHKQYPASDAELIRELQGEANDVANLRNDNVKLALGKRYFVRRGSGVDIRSILRNTATSVTMMTNPESDVKVHETRDVTASSYREQDYINADIDGVLGSFDNSSIQTNRKMNETVGGMQMLREDTNEIKEFGIRTFSETWMRPVLLQLVALEAFYESDVALLRMVGSEVGEEEPGSVLKLLQENIKVNVNVGFNSTSPAKRIEKLALAFDMLGKFIPDVIQEMDRKEVIKEVMGTVGYKDGSRFFGSIINDDQDPKVKQLEQQVQQLTQIIEQKQIEGQVKVEVANIGATTTLQVAQMNAEIKKMEIQLKGNIEGQRIWLEGRRSQIDAALRQEQNEQKRRELFLQREALSNSIREKDRDFELELFDRMQNASTNVSSNNGEGATDLSGNDKAGTIDRDRYGDIPNAPQ